MDSTNYGLWYRNFGAGNQTYVGPLSKPTTISAQSCPTSSRILNCTDHTGAPPEGPALDALLLMHSQRLVAASDSKACHVKPLSKHSSSSSILGYVWDFMLLRWAIKKHAKAS